MVTNVFLFLPDIDKPKQSPKTSTCDVDNMCNFVRSLALEFWKSVDENTQRPCILLYSVSPH